MLLFETGQLVAATPRDRDAERTITCYATHPVGDPVLIPDQCLGIVLKQETRWILVLFACMGLALWVWHTDLSLAPPEASAEPENIQNGSEGVKTISSQ